MVLGRVKIVRSEIGSEFWDVPTGQTNGLFGADTKWFLSGRSALKAILAQSKLRKAALPAWCCDSMILPFLQAGIEVSFYPVYAQNGLVQDLSGVDADGILVMDYFGYTGQVDLSGFSGTVIRDVTHSLLSKSYDDADFYFGSLRKWAGFWTGGYGWGVDLAASPADRAYVALRQRAMEEKSRYISGETGNKDYLAQFAQAEQWLETADTMAGDRRDEALARTLDVAFIKERRRANAKRLLDAFSDIAVFPQMGEQDCPMFVPILVPKGQRDALRRHLIDRQIYCPVHWPVSEYHRLDERSGALYAQELSLVCDQRYTPQDMDRIINAIKEFWKR